MIHEDRRNTEERLSDIETRVQATHALVMELHEVVFTMLKGMEDARNAPGMMGMFARNTLPEIPDMSQYTSNGIQGD